MIPLWRALPALGLAGAVGLAADRVVELLGRRGGRRSDGQSSGQSAGQSGSGPGSAFGQGAARWPLRCLFGAALAYLVLLGGWWTLPLGALAAVAAVAASQRRALPATRPQAPELAVEPGALVAAAVALALGTLVAVARPADPMYWDSFVWMGKARVAARHVGALRDLSLTPGSDVIPAGYPILYPALAAWLGGFSDAPAAVMAGEAAFQLLSLVLFVTLLLGSGARRTTTALLVLLATPLVLVHLRAAYVDLPTGLLAAALLLALRDGRSPLGAAAIAVVLTGTKDEGFVHVVAVTGVLVVDSWLGSRPAQRRAALAAFASAGVAFACWHGALQLHHVTPDHAFGPPVLSSLGPLGAALLAHLGDFVSWGALWPLVLAAGVALAVRRERPQEAVLLGITLAAQAAAFLVGLTAEDDRVRSFALAGTLLNRLLVQLAPMGALLVGAVAAPAPLSPRPR